MNYKKNIFATIIIILMFNTLFAQNNNQAMLNGILGGRDPSSLSASELSAIKSALQGQTGTNAKRQSTNNDTLQQNIFYTDSLALDSALMRDSLSFLMRDSTKDNYKVRYENLFFTSVFPEAFFERQGVASADYPIKPGDELVLSLWGAIEKQNILKVDNQGKIFVEGVGLISVAGSTLGQAENTLKTKLKSVYSGISQGRVFVGLRPQGIAPSKIFVLGNVKKPGGYSLPGDANVFLALYRAGGPDDIGSVRNIIIRRATGDSVVVDLYDLIFKGIRKGEGLLRDGDIVFVPKAEILVSVKGDVPREAIFELKAKEGAKNALFFAGGLNPTANHTLTVWRILEDGSSQPFDFGNIKDFAEGKKDTTLFFGDTLLVRASSKPASNFVGITGSVWFPGTYQLTEGMTVKEAIETAGGLREDAFAGNIIIKRINPDSSFSYLSDDSEGSKKVKLMPKDTLNVLSNSKLKISKNIIVTGAVKKELELEWQPGINLKNLIVLAEGFTPWYEPGKIFIERLKDDSKNQIEVIELKINDNLEIENRNDLILMPGDRVIVPRNPNYHEPEIITVTGAVEAPGKFALIRPRETIKDFFNRNVVFEEKAYIKGAKLFRKSDIVSKDTITKSQQYYQIALDIEKALDGKLKNKEANNLQSGDSIYIPRINPVVFVRGEVASRDAAVLYVEGWDVKDYINAAGGYTIFSDEDRIMITYADGSKATEENYDRNPDQGSEIVVGYKEPPPDTKWTEVVSAFGTIVTGIAAVLIAVATFYK